MKRIKDINLVTHPKGLITSYDTTKLLRGNLIDSFTRDGDSFFGPKPIAYARPFEESSSITPAFPYVIDISATEQWVFLSHQVTASATRIIMMYEFNKVTMAYTWKGYVNFTFPITTAHTTRGFRVTLDHYSTGTVSGSGTALTGAGTTWLTDRMNPGSVIGFGTTDPNQVTQWYEIATVTSDTAITTVTNFGTIPANTPYVIREMFVAIVTTNATAANGGLFVVKGLSELDFTALRTIAAATTVDMVKAVYWLADAATVTNTVAWGVALDEKTSQTSQNVYVPNSGTIVYVYNIRAPLTGLAAGKTTVALVAKTGTQVLTGSVSQQNNARIGTLAHGPQAGVKCLFIATTTRIYCGPLTGMITGSTSFFTDVMSEVPPGGTTSMPATAALQAVEVASSIDMLYVTTTNGTGHQSYATKFNTSTQPMDIAFITDDKLYTSTQSSPNIPIYPHSFSITMQMYAEQGYLHLCRSTGSNAAGLYCIPHAADYNFSDSTGQYAITPEIITTGAVKYYQVFVSHASRLGTDQFTAPVETFKLWYRTSGISDNTGAWMLLKESGDLSSVAPAGSIQFKISFKILGPTCIPSRLYSLALSYEDNLTDSHYEASVTKSSASTRTFAWRQTDTFGGTIPKLYVRIYDVTNNSLLLQDDSDARALGIWEYSTDGTNWNAWNDTQDVVGNYIRFIANSLPSGAKVRVSITQ